VQKNVFYNTGHGHLGWTLSAVTADMVSQIIGESIPQGNPSVLVAQQALAV
jgi:D-amino-acid dehydrogenase